MKIQMPKSKCQIKSKCQNSKIWNLDIAIWRFRIISDDYFGQGLLETIVAIGIIVSGLVGMMNLTISNQTSSEDAQERLIAVNLAREGIEVVRNMRDTNWLSCEISSGILNCNNWDQGLFSGVDTTAALMFSPATNAWTIDFSENAITDNQARIWRISSGDSALIGAQFQSADANPANSSLTSYRRLLELYSICDDKTIAPSCSPKTKIGIQVKSTVSWESRGKTTSLTAEERLFNWR